MKSLYRGSPPVLRFFAALFVFVLRGKADRTFLLTCALNVVSELLLCNFGRQIDKSLIDCKQYFGPSFGECFVSAEMGLF